MDEILKTINLVSQRDWKAGALAHGQKQWLEIGMLLAQNAKLLLVDEPAAGMTDTRETHKTGRVAPLRSSAGKHSIIVIEHDMAFVRQIAAGRKVTVLHQGCPSYAKAASMKCRTTSACWTCISVGRSATGEGIYDLRFMIFDDFPRDHAPSSFQAKRKSLPFTGDAPQRRNNFRQSARPARTLNHKS